MRVYDRLELPRTRPRCIAERCAWSGGPPFLAGSVALLGLGGYVVYDSLVRLLARERPPIGLVEVFGQRIWLGWLMIAALVATMVPAILLGRAKQRIARELHDKVLFADAEMNRADWLTAGAAILGVLGIGAGLWWAGLWWPSIDQDRSGKT